MAGCQKDDIFFIKDEAFSLVTAGYNGSNSELIITIDTMKLPNGIPANGSFKRTDKYTFHEGQDKVKVVVSEKDSGKKLYESAVNRGEYSLNVDLIYVDSKLIVRPAFPANKEGFLQASYLFIPKVSGYSGDIDIAYFKNHEVYVDNKLVVEKSEELARVTAKPNTFSPFLQAPIFESGRTEIDGKVYYINQATVFFKAGTNIPYYKDAGFTTGEYATFPYLTSTRPECVGIIESGSAENKMIDGYLQVKL
ncbi:hypothetical protein BFS30_01555 [Pedobacter steynii]|uniref:DUF4249 domain-containing protein n=2 Tax=Pedobacter steynii TaxID=430522 RepID=A0A1D7QBE9_9SPHI|nr:hypothetical protein BFS30_01555 [Pedobacter steynii]